MRMKIEKFVMSAVLVVIAAPALGASNVKFARIRTNSRSFVEIWLAAIFRSKSTPSRVLRRKRSDHG